MTSFFVPPLFNGYLSPSPIPWLPSIGLSEDELSLISQIERRHWNSRYLMELTDCYYRGEQIVTNLRIAIPAELEFIRTLVGWGKVPVDPYVERLNVDSFRLGSSIDPAQDLADIWTDNGMAAEQKLAYTDALSMGQGWFTVGSPVDESDAPRICVQSPLNIAALWDPRTFKPRAGLEWYWQDGTWHATFYASPTMTIHIARDDQQQWQIVERDDHNFGVIPIVRMANEARSNNRDGRSEITPAMMSIIDQGCRTLLGLEVSREFYAVPQKVLLGALESDFISPDGTAKTAWQTYISSMLALERDPESGELPDLKQLQAFDPAVFTKILAELAAQFSGMTGALPQDLGLYTSGNPVSADGWDASDARRERRTAHKRVMYSPSIAETMQIAVRFLNNGDLPDSYKRISVDWDDPQQYSFTSAADGVSKLVNEGVWSAKSDVTLKRTGLSAVERAQMAKDIDADPAAEELAELDSVEAKNIIAAARLDKALVPVPGEPAALDPAPSY